MERRDELSCSLNDSDNPKERIIEAGVILSFLTSHRPLSLKGSLVSSFTTEKF